jgi:alginate O-acetyltransferase complex protein AlgJ
MPLPTSSTGADPRQARGRPVRLPVPLERLLIATFLVVLVGPLIGTAFGVARTTAEQENRTLASFPHPGLTRSSWEAFPRDLKRYFVDNFAFRPMLVRWQALIRIKAFDVSPSRSVIKGSNGWWFYAEDGAMDDYAEAPPFTATELEQWRRTLQDTTDWLRARGIVYLFVIAPDKHEVYPEYMPSSIRRAVPTRTDQLVAELAAHSTVPVLNLLPILEEHKADERLYHRTDSHWNDRGAYIAYSAILSSLSALPETSMPTAAALRPVPFSDFEAGQVRHGGFDLARMVGLDGVLEEDDLMLLPRRPRAAVIIEPPHPDLHGVEGRLVTSNPATSAPRAIVFRDSFGSGLIPFLSEHFSRVVYLWQNNVDPGVIAEEHPSVVIQEMVGRRFSTLTPYDPFEPEREVSPPASTRQTSPARRATDPR